MDDDATTVVPDDNDTLSEVSSRPAFSGTPAQEDWRRKELAEAKLRDARRLAAVPEAQQAPPPSGTDVPEKRNEWDSDPETMVQGQSSIGSRTSQRSNYGKGLSHRLRKNQRAADHHERMNIPYVGRQENLSASLAENRVQPKDYEEALKMQAEALREAQEGFEVLKNSKMHSFFLDFPKIYRQDSTPKQLSDFSKRYDHCEYCQWCKQGHVPRALVGQRARQAAGAGNGLEQLVGGPQGGSCALQGDADAGLRRCDGRGPRDLLGP